MKRDMELVRCILQQVEQEPAAVRADSLGFKESTPQEALYHVEIMRQGGLLDAHVTFADGHVPYSGVVYGLTWDGHDFLDAVRDESVWRATRSKLAGVAGTTAFEVLKNLAIQASAAALL